MQSVQLTEGILHSSDCVVILTDHTCIDYNFVACHAKVIVDARNATKNIDYKYKNNVIKI
jgi:UDP-N-acetyl-D-glucosamine dehydrogenase